MGSESDDPQREGSGDDRSLLCGSVRGRMFQTEFISILTPDLSDNPGHINSTGTVGHPENLSQNLGFLNLNKIYSSIWSVPSFKALSSLIPSGKPSD